MGGGWGERYWGGMGVLGGDIHGKLVGVFFRVSITFFPVLFTVCCVCGGV